VLTTPECLLVASVNLEGLLSMKWVLIKKDQT